VQGSNGTKVAANRMGMDYTEITERPGSRLNAEQMARFVHRYATSYALVQGRVLEVACGAAIGLGGLQARLRRVAVPLAAKLKGLVYGQLEPLPSELAVDVLQQAVATLALQPLPNHQPDTVHRVLYARGRAPGPV
jgi:hypothetical protein